MDRPDLVDGGMSLLESGGLTPIGTPMRNQAQKFRILEEEQRRFRPVIYWYLTFRCNLACAHCSVHSSPWVDNAEDLTTAECMEVIEQMHELSVRAAFVTGGEFLIRQDSIQILKALFDKDIGVGLETNGLRYPPGFVELAREMQAQQKLSMTISLDGGTKETHERLRGPRSFDRTIEGLRFLKQNGIRFNIQCVLNSSNCDTIPNLYALAEELAPECRAVQWAILNPIGRGAGLVKELGLKPEHIPTIFKLISQYEGGYRGSTIIKVPPAVVPPKYLPLVFQKADVRPLTTCQFPLLGVLPNGDVSICALSRDNEDLHFGNIREGIRLKGIWEKTRMSMLRSSYVAADDLKGICGDCVWKYNCKGSCRAWAYEEGGDFDAAFPLCKALDEAGSFPKAYKLSHQNAAAAAHFQQMGGGCGCGT
jgi:radical SAM protein with 4Fe4S-binding SPASM domain